MKDELGARQLVVELGEPFEPGWVAPEEMHDAERGVFAWLRKGQDTRARCLVVVNFTPQVYYDYRVRVPFAGRWREVLNTNAAIYGGSDVGNAGAVKTLDEGSISEVSLVIPPLAAIFLVPEQ